MCMSVLSACMYLHMCAWCPQKALDPLGLGPQTIVSCHMGAANKQGPLQEHLLLITARPSCQPQVGQTLLLWSPWGFQGGKALDENVYLALFWMPFSKMALVIIIILCLFEWVAWLPPVSYRGWFHWMIARRTQQTSPGQDNSVLPWSLVLNSVSAWHRKHPISDVE